MRLSFLSLLTAPLLLATTSLLTAQPIADADGSLGVGTLNPDPSALLELNSTTQGVLLPRMNSAQRDGIVNPAEGLIIFNTETGRLEIWSNSSGQFQWQNVGSPGVANAWITSGNGALVDGTSNFLGTTDPVRVRMVVGGVEQLVLNTNGSLARSISGNARGTGAVDLQTFRSGATQVASGQGAFVGAGGNNTASGINAFVGGGAGNSVTNLNAAIVGGFQNQVTGQDDFIGAGASNTASGNNSAVVSGVANRASAGDAFVGAGFENLASGYQSFVGGGYRDTASGDRAVVAGGYINRATGPRTTVSGGWANVASANAATIGGGADNLASGLYATVGGGNGDTASGNEATVGGGFRNSATGTRSTVGGGFVNVASANASTIGGGADNSVSGEYGTVAGGRFGSSTGLYGALGGGLSNAIAGDYAAIPGGRGMTIDTGADGSFAFLGGNAGSNDMTINTPSIAVFGNVDLWLANNDTTARALRFYEAQSSTGAFPNGANFSSFQAGSQSDDIIYVLPEEPGSVGDMLMIDAVSGDTLFLIWEPFFEFQFSQAEQATEGRLDELERELELRDERIRELERKVNELDLLQDAVRRLRDDLGSTSRAAEIVPTAD